MGQPGRIGIAQFVLLALTAVGLVTIFSSSHQEEGGAIRPVGRRLPMPDFNMQQLDGAEWSLSAHKGRVVLVNFWATWCPPCREEIPGLVRLANSRSGLDIAGIAMDDGQQIIRQFVRAAKMPYPVLLPTSSFLVDAIQSLPTTFLVDKQGKVARQYIGAYSERTLSADVDKVLAEL